MNYPNLKAYFSFLLNGHLDDLIKESIYEIQKLHLTELGPHAGCSEDDIIKFLEITIEEFLLKCASRTGGYSMMARTKNWKEVNAPAFSLEKVTLETNICVHQTIKRSLIKQIKNFTTDFTTYQELVNELEEYFAGEQKLSLEKVEQTNAELQNINMKLESRIKEQTLELSKREKELKDSSEETIALNKKISERESFFWGIIDQSPFSTWIANTDGTLVRINKACQELFGIKSAEPIVGWYNIFKDPVIREKNLAQEIAKVFSEGRIVNFTIDYDISKISTLNEPKYNLITIVNTIFPVKDASGKVTHAVFQHEDITQRKLAEEALRKSEERYKTFIQHSSEAIWRFELEGTSFIYINLPVNEQIEIFYQLGYLAECNDAMARMYGFEKAEEIIGVRLENLLIKTETANIEFLSRFISEGYKLKDAESLEVDKEDNTKYFLNNLVGITENGKLIRVWGIQQDITTRKNIEIALENALNQAQEKNKELKRINEILDDFVYMAAHDLRSPVANIKLIGSTLKRTTDIEIKQELFNTIEHSIFKLDQTIKGLVEVIEIQNSENLIKPVIFSDILHKVLYEYQPELDTIGAKIKANFDESPSIKYVEAHILSIFKNLIGNALKYHADERALEINIISQKIDGYTLLKFDDNGMGIDLSKHGKNLFRPFTRLTQRASGTGMGLYMIKNIIEKNGGKIEVSSELNKFSAFTLYLKEY